jgi:type IV pilus assembly protein PilB
MKVADNDLKKFILDTNLLSRTALEKAVEEARVEGIALEDVVVRNGSLSPDALRKLKSYALGIPFVSLKDKKIPLETLAQIPEPLARTKSIIAFDQKDKDLYVAMLDTLDIASIESLAKKTGMRVVVRLTDEESIKNALVQYQKSLKEEFGDLIAQEAGKLSIIGEPKESSGDELKKLAEELPIVKIVDSLLRHAIVQKASDIHIEHSETSVIIRYRIDGILHDAMTLPRAAASGIVARIKVLSNLKLDEKRLPQDGRFKIETDVDKVSFRVSLLPTFYGEKIVMRLLRETGEGFTLEKLGFHGSTMEKIHMATKQTTGIILVSGPTGSGKTTTLYTILDILNTPDVNISTIEDPIEYQMKRVNQSQVNPSIGFTFAAGLRALLRQDPNIIMVGEIRDKETASLAINAALTGHIVLSTIHTNSSSGAIPRLIDMGIEPFLLASTLRVIVGQRLVRQLTPHKEQYVLSKPERAKVLKEEHFEAAFASLQEEKIIDAKTKLDTLPFYHPKAGDDNPDGYQGRMGIHEVFAVSSTLRELIMQGATADKLEEQARKEGMLTMLEDGIYKAARGITSLEEVLRAVSE